MMKKTRTEELPELDNYSDVALSIWFELSSDKIAH